MVPGLHVEKLTELITERLWSSLLTKQPVTLGGPPKNSIGSGMLAVAKVVDIWGTVITPIPKLTLNGNFASRAPRKPLTDLLIIKEVARAKYGSTDRFNTALSFTFK